MGTGRRGAYAAEHALGVEGPLREFYTVSSHETADQALWRTEIGRPIFHTGPVFSSTSILIYELSRYLLRRDDLGAVTRDSATTPLELEDPMTSLAHRTIADLRTLHDELAALVPTLTEAQLTGPSGASEWTVAQVLSHLGSGSEISLATFQAALTGAPGPGSEFNQGVWDRWNAMDPGDQATGFLAHDAKLVETVEALTPEQRESLRINVGFAPSALEVSTFTGMRLNELALHSWDVRVALDPEAALSEETAEVLVEQFSGGMGFLLGFLGKAEAVAEPAVVDVHGHRLVVSTGVSLSSAADDDGQAATADFAGPLEAFARLIGGRLTPAHTPADVSVSGNVSLDDLRRVFPGF
jgi:uncharacterized protein (TIGR03083 family)